MPWQFSCYLPDDPNFPRLKKIAEDFEKATREDTSFKLCRMVGVGLLAGAIKRSPLIAAYNCCQYVEARYRRGVDDQAEKATGAKREEIDKRRWWSRMQLIGTVGHHEFYA